MSQGQGGLKVGWTDVISRVYCVYIDVYIYIHIWIDFIDLYIIRFIYIYVYSMHVYTFVLVNQPDHSTICHRVSACHRSDPIPVVW